MHKELAFIGLGRMGAAMTARLTENGYAVHGYDSNKDARIAAKQNRVVVYESIADAVGALDAPRTIWVMVPTRFVDEVLTELRPLLSRGDTIIDGGNSFFQDSIHRHNDLLGDQVNYIDCGTSGGVEGARRGASLMAGGEKDIVEKHRHLFEVLATQDGFGHVGGPGAGHFVKMVHNGIEYGMMGAIAEGMNVLDEHKEGLALDIKQALQPYQHGSIIESNLMDWLADAFNTEGYLEKIAGSVPRGETEMEMEYLVDHQQVRVLDAALLQRKLTRLQPSFIGTLIAAMRNQFGGHKIIEKKNENS